MSILDFISKRPAYGTFRPASPESFIGLRLAQKLGEPATANHFAQLATEYSPESISAAYRRAITSQGTGDLVRRFHLELRSVGAGVDQQSDDRLLAIKIERRAIAIAVFAGNRLDFHDTRSLSSQSNKAEASAIGFLSWVTDNFQIESATLERMPVEQEIRRTLLNQAAVSLLRSGGIPLWDVSKAELLAAYAHPSLRTRAELRITAQTVLWSMLDTSNPEPHEIDAAALGLYVQTERLFRN